MGIMEKCVHQPEFLARALIIAACQTESLVQGLTPYKYDDAVDSEQTFQRTPMKGKDRQQFLRDVQDLMNEPDLGLAYLQLLDHAALFDTNPVKVTWNRIENWWKRKLFDEQRRYMRQEFGREINTGEQFIRATLVTPTRADGGRVYSVYKGLRPETLEEFHMILATTNPTAMHVNVIEQAELLTFYRNQGKKFQFDDGSKNQMSLSVDEAHVLRALDLKNQRRRILQDMRRELLKDVIFGTTDPEEIAEAFAEMDEEEKRETAELCLETEVTLPSSLICGDEERKLVEDGDGSSLDLTAPSKTLTIEWQIKFAELCKSVLFPHLDVKPPVAAVPGAPCPGTGPWSTQVLLNHLTDINSVLFPLCGGRPIFRERTPSGKGVVAYDRKLDGSRGTVRTQGQQLFSIRAFIDNVESKNPLRPQRFSSVSGEAAHFIHFRINKQPRKMEATYTLECSPVSLTIAIGNDSAEAKKELMTALRRDARAFFAHKDLRATKLWSQVLFTTCRGSSMSARLSFFCLNLTNTLTRQASVYLVRQEAERANRPIAARGDERSFEPSRGFGDDQINVGRTTSRLTQVLMRAVGCVRNSDSLEANRIGIFTERTFVKFGAHWIKIGGSHPRTIFSLMQNAVAHRVGGPARDCTTLPFLPMLVRHIRRPHNFPEDVAMKLFETAVKSGREIDPVLTGRFDQDYPVWSDFHAMRGLYSGTIGEEHREDALGQAMPAVQEFERICEFLQPAARTASRTWLGGFVTEFSERVFNKTPNLKSPQILATLSALEARLSGYFPPLRSVAQTRAYGDAQELAQTQGSEDPGLALALSDLLVGPRFKERIESYFPNILDENWNPSNVQSFFGGQTQPGGRTQAAAVYPVD
eukprot:GHVN01004069.1.p1 GENE.GHVN01004069.1~~GHVN01004069.1.p1  ORF type:complete len:947 (+),score=16.19 GHVN01004069.1:235-2841(+)